MKWERETEARTVQAAADRTAADLDQRLADTDQNGGGRRSTWRPMPIRRWPNAISTPRTATRPPPIGSTLTRSADRGDRAGPRCVARGTRRRRPRTRDATAAGRLKATMGPAAGHSDSAGLRGPGARSSRGGARSHGRRPRRREQTRATGKRTTTTPPACQGGYVPSERPSANGQGRSAPPLHETGPPPPTTETPPPRTAKRQHWIADRRPPTNNQSVGSVRSRTLPPARSGSRPAPRPSAVSADITRVHVGPPAVTIMLIRLRGTTLRRRRNPRKLDTQCPHSAARVKRTTRTRLFAS